MGFMYHRYSTPGFKLPVTIDNCAVLFESKIVLTRMRIYKIRLYICQFTQGLQIAFYITIYCLSPWRSYMLEYKLKIRFTLLMRLYQCSQFFYKDSIVGQANFYAIVAMSQYFAKK